MITVDSFNELIDDAIDHLCDDNIEYGAGCLREIAELWAKAGLPQQSFMDMRQHIINQAIERVGNAQFVELKLELAEKDSQRERNFTKGHSNIIIN